MIKRSLVYLKNKNLSILDPAIGPATFLKAINKLKINVKNFDGYDIDNRMVTISNEYCSKLKYANKIFNEERGRIGFSIEELEREVLIIPQVTLSVNTNKGSKPSISSAAEPSDGRDLFNKFSKIMLQKNKSTFFGIFGANMSVSIVNQGPITFMFSIN